MKTQTNRSQTSSRLVIAASLAASFAFMAPASAQSPDSGEAFLLEMMGERAWEVSCQLTQGDGDSVATRERGRGLLDNGRFSVGDVVSGLCTYSVPDRGELRLTLNVEHTQLACPFTVTEAGFCRAYLQPGDSGSFNIQRRTTPVSTGS
ncbi:hypothetical protein [Maricaulis maris]|jgi:hypothetical protein|uniref:hypothetical protein n=1 Tax=Maricaulis maris TaxID=74318 RepID=UPI0029271DFE|nr:hypothetical protein MACH15_01570 [Maricaulis maris]